MSNIDKRGLREAAEKATKGRWAVEFDDEIYSTDGVNHEQIAMVFSENEARDAAFIAAANPPPCWRCWMSWKPQRRIAELEARNLTIPDEIDFDHENEYGEHGGNGESWMRGRVQGFNEAIRKVKRNAIAAGIITKVGSRDMATLQELIESEIGDFFAGFSSPGEPESPADMQSQLLARISPLLASMEQEPVAR